MMHLKRSYDAAQIIGVKPLRRLRVDLRQTAVQRLCSMRGGISLLPGPKRFIGALLRKTVIVAQ
ncbi:hypothetical protein D3C78_1920030 [compost metagenome]